MKKTKQQEYNREYWEQNREDLLRARKDRYHKDKRMRELTIERARVRSKLKMFSDPTIITYSLYQISKMVSVSYWRLNEMRKKGQIPKGPYTEEQMFKIVEEIKNEDSKQKKRDSA